MKKLYLHMGFGKTGTTSFQDFCRDNVDCLLKQGIIYPILNSDHAIWKNIHNHGFPITTMFNPFPEKKYHNIVMEVNNINGLCQDYFKIFKKCLSTKNTVIISGEEIPYLSKEAFIKLKKFIDIYEFEIIPILIVRSPYSFWCSAQQEWIKSGMQLQGINPFIHAPLIDKIKEVFPDTKIYSFIESCKHSHGPTGFLLEKMGVDYGDFKFITTNESISNVITRVQSELNKKDFKIINDTLNPYFTSIIDLDNKKAFPQKYLLTEAEYTQVKDQCEAENAYFREHLGEEFCDKEIKFSEEDATVKLCTRLIDRLENKFEKKKLAQEEHKKEILNLQEKFLMQGRLDTLQADYNIQNNLNNTQNQLNMLKSYANLTYLKRTYLRYRIASEITVGKTKKRYKAKKHNLKYLINLFTQEKAELNAQENKQQEYNLISQNQMDILKGYSIPQYLKFTYLRYRIASEITFGKTKKRYKQKKHILKQIIKNI